MEETKPDTDGTVVVKGSNALNDPEERKKFKAQLLAMGEYFRIIEDQNETIKEMVGELSEIYEIKKPIVRKLAKALYDCNYEEQLEDSNLFQELYEVVIEGKYRDVGK